jgi:predicted nucleotidyltransferase
MHTDLAKAAKLLGIELPAMEKASKASKELANTYKGLLEKRFSVNPPRDFGMTEVVLLGSIAREEGSPKSDCDYYVLQQGAPPSTTRELILAMEKMLIDLGHRKPGAERVFGEIVVAANLYESIGLELDSNANMTRRILLLSESKPITKGDTYEQVLNNILHRYCADYTPPNRPKDSEARVPSVSE